MTTKEESARDEPDSPLEPDLHRLLDSVAGDNVWVLGVGNRLRGDDGAGAWVADQLLPAFEHRVVNAGVAPENYLERIARQRPGCVLVIDAADFNGQPGEVRLLDPEEAAFGGLSTHAPSLKMVAEYLSARCAAKVVLLAIQPARTGWADTLSPPVARSTAKLAEALSKLLPRV